jgi:hypothetical protein
LPRHQGNVLTATEALVYAPEPKDGPIHILDLATGRLFDLPGGTLQGHHAIVLPGRKSFCFWRSAGTASQLCLYQFGLPSKVLYQSQPGVTLTECRWWPKGNAVLAGFQCGPGQCRLMRISLSGSTKEVAPAVMTINGLCGMPDGRNALLSSGGGGITMLVDTRTGQARTIDTRASWQRSCGWPAGANLALYNARLSRQGNRLHTTFACFCYKGGPGMASQLRRTTGIYSLKPDGSGITRVPIPPRADVGNSVSWPTLVDLSPKGSRLLFAYNRRDGLWLADLDGKNVREVPGAGRRYSAACWSD